MNSSEPSQEWIDTTKASIKEVFELFDKDKSEFIIQEEIGAVMRALGVYPDEFALVKEIIPELQDHEPTGFVRYVYTTFSMNVLMLCMLI